MTRVRLTPRAKNDLRQIAQYTERAWGKAQRDLYLKELDERFFWLAKNPRRGRSRSDIAEGYFSRLHNSHVIFYLITADGIDVIGVLHQSMDIADRLSDSDV